jgi:hypothetical protein
VRNRGFGRDFAAVAGQKIGDPRAFAILSEVSVNYS